MKQKKQSVVFQMLEWRPTAGIRTSNALIPIVGDKAVNAEDHTTFCDVEEPAYRRNKARYTQRERERERGTKSISIHKMQQLQIRTTTTF